MSDIKHYFFGTEEDTEVVDCAILIKDSAFNFKDLKDNYVSKLKLDPAQLIAFNLKYTNDKVTAKAAKAYLEELISGIDSLGISSLYIADATYFKYATGVKKTTDQHGEVVPCSLKGYEHIKCILGVNHRAALYDPKQLDVLHNSLTTLENHIDGSHTSKEVEIAYADYYDTPDYNYMFRELTKFVYTHKTLAIDIETWGAGKGDGLRFNKNVLESIAFSWSDDSGSAFMVQGDKNCLYELKRFFIGYEGTCIYHNGLFDIKNIIYHCFMKDENDFEGMFEGIQVMTKNIDDTMLMTYLATNSTAGNVLGLKENTQEFTGNYAEDVKDVRKLPVKDLLKYNLIDTLATYWLYNKRSKDLTTEDQWGIYKEVFIPAIPALLEMMLVGLPMDMDKVADVDHMLTAARTKAKLTIDMHPLVQKAQFKLATAAMVIANKRLKKKIKPVDDFIEPFNPGSNTQKAVLFYEVMKLPILDTTDSGLPSCSGKTIKKLLNHVSTEEDKELLEAFKSYLDTDKILGTFIKAFNAYEFKRSGTSWLNGNQKLGGTLSGRLSSSEPNLANLPSNSKYGKAIKSCFRAPEGWLFAGSDYSALEDRVVAIISKDPNKTRIFSEGIDGHCLNAYGYYSDQMPDINPDDPDSINSIADKYAGLRQDSKSSTFALNYAGTAMTLHFNNGIPMDQAISIEEGHKEMYKVMHAWGEGNKKLMTTQGYISCAYGLKVRTPMLARSLINSHITPSVVKAEFRSGNNAVTQSHGLMTTVAGTRFRERLEKSKHRYSVLMINYIHDAVYLLIKEDPEVIKWVNENLIDCMINAGDEQVQKDTVVGIEAELEIGKSWDVQVGITNGASIAEIQEVLKDL